LKFHKKEQALLVKIANDLSSICNSQENLSDDVRQIKEELRNQKELTSQVIELLTTKSSASSNSSNTISIEEFRKKPKLSGIHQLWWAVSKILFIGALR
jgi:hypothetical protein